MERAKAAILKRVEARIGKPVDPDKATEDDFRSPMGTSLDLVGYLLYDDQVFEEVLMAEKPLALVSYLVGESCLLSRIGCFFKGPGPTGVLPLHADTLGPQPVPSARERRSRCEAAGRPRGATVARGALRPSCRAATGARDSRRSPRWR